MATATILVGVLVGWAAAICCGCSAHDNPWVNRLIAIVGGLIGAYLASTMGAGEAVATAIWAAAGAIVVCDLVGLLMGGD